MGNCIDLMSCRPQKSFRVLIPGRGEVEFKAFIASENITSGCYLGHKLVHHARPCMPLPPATKLKFGELYYLLPCFGHCCRLPVHKRRVDGGGNRGWKVKVVVSREQLELLFRNAEKFQAKAQAFWSRDGCRRWQSSLATIPE